MDSHTLPRTERIRSCPHLFAVKHRGSKRLQRVLRWRQSCRASALILTSSKCHSLRPAGRTSDFQFQLTSLQIFTLPSSLKTTLSTSAWISWNSALQLAQRKEKRRIDLSRNRQSFLTTSSARRQCNQPSTNVLMEIRRACLGHRSGVKHIGRQTQWQTSTCTVGAEIG